MKYRVIYADPPWRFGSRGIKAGKFQRLETEYPTMTTKEICDLPVEAIVQDDAALFLWVTSAHLMNAAEVMRAWGFVYSRVDSVWGKRTCNGKPAMTVGPWGMNDCELLLMGTKGKMLKYQKVKNLTQLVLAEREGHSVKPACFRDRIVQRFGDVRRLEMFARQATPGWSVWGLDMGSGVLLNA